MELPRKILIGEGVVSEVGAIVRSLDAGATWSRPIKINRPSGKSPNIRNHGNYMLVDPVT